MKLIFVYNAKSGFLNGMMDSVHKIVSPDTYECSLCAITYGSFSMDKGWKEYLRQLPHQVEFRYRKDFREAYPDVTDALPAIFVEEAEKPKTIVTATEMKAQKSVDQLISTLNSALSRQAVS